MVNPVKGAEAVEKVLIKAEGKDAVAAVKGLTKAQADVATKTLWGKTKTAAKWTAGITAAGYGAKKLNQKYGILGDKQEKTTWEQIQETLGLGGGDGENRSGFGLGALLGAGVLGILGSLIPGFGTIGAIGGVLIGALVGQPAMDAITGKKSEAEKKAAEDTKRAEEAKKKAAAVPPISPLGNIPSPVTPAVKPEDGIKKPGADKGAYAGDF